MFGLKFCRGDEKNMGFLWYYVWWENPKVIWSHTFNLISYLFSIILVQNMNRQGLIINFNSMIFFCWTFSLRIVDLHCKMAWSILICCSTKSYSMNITQFDNSFFDSTWFRYVTFTLFVQIAKLISSTISLLTISFLSIVFAEIQITQVKCVQHCKMRYQAI